VSWEELVISAEQADRMAVAVVYHVRGYDGVYWVNDDRSQRGLIMSGFLYIASVSVIPELLAESRSGMQALKEVGHMLYESVGAGSPALLERHLRRVLIVTVRRDGFRSVLHGEFCA
jgi:hypothetical protein